MQPPAAPDQLDEPDVRGRAVVWSTGSLDRSTATPPWRRVLTSAGLVGGAALGLSGLLVGVATWSVVTPVDGQPPRPLWVSPPRVEDKVAVAATESPSTSPTALPTPTIEPGDDSSHSSSSSSARVSHSATATPSSRSATSSTSSASSASSVDDRGGRGDGSGSSGRSPDGSSSEGSGGGSGGHGADDS